MVQKLEQLLSESGYGRDKATYLVNDFRSGFSIGYEGNPEVQFT